jgi:beta-alanine degradation protein BauB
VCGLDNSDSFLLNNKVSVKWGQLHLHLDYKDMPADKTNQHRHNAFALYALSDFKRSITLPDGRVLQRQFKAGDVMWSDAQTHVGTNTGETPTHVILVEMKSQIGPCAAR